MSWLKLLKLRSLFIPEGVRLHLHPAALERMDLNCWIHTMSCGNLQTSHKCKKLEELQNIIWQWWDRDNLYDSMSWSRKWQPTSVFLPGKFHGHRSLTGWSLWGCKESDTIERLRRTRDSMYMIQKRSKRFYNIKSQDSEQIRRWRRDKILQRGGAAGKLKLLFHDLICNYIIL